MKTFRFVTTTKDKQGELALSWNGESEPTPEDFADMIDSLKAKYPSLSPDEAVRDEKNLEAQNPDKLTTRQFIKMRDRQEQQKKSGRAVALLVGIGPTGRNLRRKVQNPTD